MGALVKRLIEALGYLAQNIDPAFGAILSAADELRWELTIWFWEDYPEFSEVEDETYFHDVQA
jgi:hypothetical protein